MSASKRASSQAGAVAVAEREEDHSKLFASVLAKTEKKVKARKKQPTKPKYDIPEGFQLIDDGKERVIGVNVEFLYYGPARHKAWVVTVNGKTEQYREIIMLGKVETVAKRNTPEEQGCGPEYKCRIKTSGPIAVK